VQDNQQDAARLVGFLEYGKALQDFERLARIASPQELKVMDELLRNDSQYTVHVNLVRRMPQSAESAFAPTTDRDARGGLSWIIGLARLEYGAMLAGFTKELIPFPSPPRDSLDGRAFDELLVESALMHAWALQNDPIVRGLLATPAPSGRTGPPPQLTKYQILAYERRVSLTWKTLQAVEARLGARMNAEQRGEFLALSRGIGQLRAFIRKDLLNLGGGLRNTVRRPN